jgi:hypothetical protein
MMRSGCTVLVELGKRYEASIDLIGNSLWVTMLVWRMVVEWMCRLVDGCLRHLGDCQVSLAHLAVGNAGSGEQKQKLAIRTCDWKVGGNGYVCVWGGGSDFKLMQGVGGGRGP